MSPLPVTGAGRRASSPALNAAGLAGLIVSVALSLAACQGGEAMGATPGGDALIAARPAVAARNVPPPPAIGDVVSAPVQSASSPASSELGGVNAQLDAAFDKASACSADTECRAVPVGARSCGGPTGYRAYSTKSGSAADLDALAQRQRELSAEAARASHQVSPCFMLANPGARCYQNKCVTGRAAPN